MLRDQTKDLFQLQAELVDVKVDMAVNKAIQQVVEQISNLRNEMHVQISGLRNEMHDLRHEMRDRFSSLEGRVTAVETKLGMVSESRKEIRTRMIDYCFKAGWLLLAATVSYFALQLQVLIK